MCRAFVGPIVEREFGPFGQHDLQRDASVRRFVRVRHEREARIRASLRIILAARELHQSATAIGPAVAREFAAIAHAIRIGTRKDHFRLARIGSRLC